MKVSRNWLQQYFDTPLPSVTEIVDAFTFHAFEIEESTDDMIDVKVLPNRAADCFCHRGIAKELSAILDMPMKRDPLREPLPVLDIGSPTSKPLSIVLETAKSARQMGAIVRGVKIGPSPEWLKTALEAVGQRSINNIVDATNYVTFNMGQPIHAFDAGKIQNENGAWRIAVRDAKEGEKVTVLSGETYVLPKGAMVIANAITGEALDIAGIKGGKTSAVDGETTTFYVSVANFDGTTIRRTAQTLKLFTEASSRFQNRPSPELVAYGMRDVLALIKKVAGGEVEGVVDVYPAPAGTPKDVSVTLEQINGILGSNFSDSDVENVFKRLALPYMVVNDSWTITPPFERTDLTIPEDLVEEVGRILGYDRVAPVALPAIEGEPDQARFRGIERMKDELVGQGFTEVSTQSFAKEGEIYLANPLDKTKPALRVSLEQNLNEALERANRCAPLVLPPNEKLKLFEVGTVFPKEGEYLELRMTERVKEWGDAANTVDNLSIAKLEEYGKDYEPKRYKLGTYKPFSAYPFIVRDIALWVPVGADEGHTKSIIRENAGSLLARLDQFDTFEKERRVSYAFRLVFESRERTLTDEEVSGVMERVTKALSVAGYEVR